MRCEECGTIILVLITAQGVGIFAVRSPKSMQTNCPKSPRITYFGGPTTPKGKASYSQKGPWPPKTGLLIARYPN